MKLTDNIVERLAAGDAPPLIDPVGDNYKVACEQAAAILKNQFGPHVTLSLLALITKIQQQQKSIEMLEYNQKWRKRRP